jgi:hypothetical protein
MNPTIAAAAWLLLTGQAPAPVQVPSELKPPVVIDCPAPANHLTVRWVGDREYHHHHHHHHHHGGHR